MRTDGWDAEFAARYERLSVWPTPMVGVEHEYTVQRGRRMYDFRSVMAARPPGLTYGLDPGDLLAGRARSGLAVTADGAEAEFATPPLPVTAGFTDELSRWVSHGYDQLLGIARGTGGSSTSPELQGYSTHISVSADQERADAVGLLMAESFGVALVLLADDPTGCGVWIRPRLGRTEICTSHAADERLTSLVVFSVAASIGCHSALALRHPSLDHLDVRLPLRPASQRSGWFIDGRELRSRGRQTVLRRRDGTPVSAQRYLEEAWATIRPAIAEMTSTADLVVTDDAVGGWRSRVSRRRRPSGVPAGPHRGGVGRPTSSYGHSLPSRTRPGFSVSPVVSTWATTVFAVDVRGRQLFVSTPAPALDAMLDDLDRGQLDGLLSSLAAGPAPVPRRTLQSWQDAQRPGVWHEMSDVGALVPPEAAGGSTSSPRVPDGQPPQAPGPRPGKPVLRPEPPARRPARPRRRAVLAGLAALALLAGAVTAILGLRGGHSGVATGPTGCSTSLAFPTQGWFRSAGSCHLEMRSLDVSIDADDGSFAWHAHVDASPTVETTFLRGELGVNFFGGASQTSQFFHVTITEDRPPPAGCVCLSYRSFVSDWGQYPDQQVAAVRVTFDDGSVATLRNDGGRFYMALPGAHAVVHLEADFKVGSHTKTLVWP